MKTVETAPWRYDGWISTRDLVMVARLVVCAVAAALPRRTWPFTARLAGRLHVSLRRRGFAALAKPAALLNVDARALAMAATAEDYREQMETIGEYLPGRRTTLVLEGRSALDAALQSKRGVVLWVSQQAHCDLATKKALATAGFRLHHLSTPSHPYSPTRFGGMVLNPVRLHAVNRYLASRVLVVYGRSRPAIEALRQILRDNGIVSIVAAGTGQRTLQLPFLGGTMDLAGGAPGLAHDSGAALFPVFTLPDGPDGYRIELGPDLNTRAESDRNLAVRTMTERFVRLLEPVVRERPASWQGWFHPGTWRP